ncbi:hypothetical protein GRX03_14840 [Halovenus sp. WSH3]|uniref:Cox cluster protein n=1 Tax=Halovenus carboxidivorans TaxID=2692199 RepID=A0A6B0T9F6_9EURY|nr:hypothetical protein [Halovenus carboxidivorans]MXR52876.1 hypothetical protein [Halovenus carboxidivorans]
MDGNRGVVLYLVGVVGVAGLTVALLGQLYVSRVPEFTRSLVANPIRAVGGDPVAVGLILGTVLSTALLVALVVGFGARYATEE